ncbi:AmmeMemoRadiSam system protein B [Alkalimarinus coralli]|uniref:AmmeMemoRadiSam system protein B n=1 Tax=Alkalimarinus coralli TaxID=2935863 RepID=UPI00202B1F31|nr:AmmeMemoRadiSam system protein B [Alkalimarinus coralli]
MSLVRMPAVSGLFYTSQANVLKREVISYLDEASQYALSSPPSPSKALIVPHAGYIYSGVYAAVAYKSIDPSSISRVVLLGPSHQVPLRGVALSSAEYFRTPLGDVATDKSDFDRLLQLPSVKLDDQAHLHEHSLEVQIPFLQEVLGGFELLPVVVGLIKPVELAGFLSCVWGAGETLVVVSSDLSHYHSYQEAQIIDKNTSDKILRFDTHIQGDQACGCYAVNGLLFEANRRGLKAKALVVANSGDTAGDKARVVGYGAYAFS